MKVAKLRNTSRVGRHVAFVLTIATFNQVCENVNVKRRLC